MSRHDLLSGLLLILGALVLPTGLAADAGAADSPSEEKETAAAPVVLLDLPGSGTDPERIDSAALPRLAGEHVVISPPDDAWKFRLHNYLTHHDGRFWCMWSHGPVVEDVPSQHVRFATSEDGLNWSESRMLTDVPQAGNAYIARGFWLREGQLLALAAHYKGKGAFGVDKELKLQAFAWNPQADRWEFHGTLFENAINNFPPQKVASGEWMLTRRDSRFNVFMLKGGVAAFDDWRSVPVVKRQQFPGFIPDEPIWWSQPDGELIALYRDNGGSQRIFHSVSTDSGETWSPPRRTNFPNSTSKLFSLVLSNGDRVLISNANPKLGRRELHLSLSRDGKTFRRMALLDIPSQRPSTLQYPHAIEREEQLLIAFSRNKQWIELFRVPVQHITALWNDE